MSFSTDMDRGEMADEALGLAWPDPLDPDVFIRVANLTEREQRQQALGLLKSYLSLHDEFIKCGLETGCVESMATDVLWLHRLGIFDWAEMLAYAEVASVLNAKDREEFEAGREWPPLDSCDA